MENVVKVVSASDTYEIRKEVLRKGMDLPVTFKEDFEDTTFHLGGYTKDKLQGIATFIASNNERFDTPQYQLRGMATIPEARGLGLGKSLLLQSFEILKERGISVLWCNAREVAVPFYKKLGFTIQGEVFHVDQVGPHYTMYIHL